MQKINHGYLNLPYLRYRYHGLQRKQVGMLPKAVVNRGLLVKSYRRIYRLQA